MTERPFECSGCHKEICSIYKEMVGTTTIISEMCQECPVLQQKLHGAGHRPDAHALMGEKGLVCGDCNTSLEAVQMGSLLGCSQCYSVFGEVLIRELAAAKKIPETLRQNSLQQKNQPLHVGRSPVNTEAFAPSSRLTALNEALNEALKKENYEQAAWLRDQIKALTEKPKNEK